MSWLFTVLVLQRILWKLTLEAALEDTQPNSEQGLRTRRIMPRPVPRLQRVRLGQDGGWGMGSGGGWIPSSTFSKAI